MMLFPTVLMSFPNSKVYHEKGKSISSNKNLFSIVAE